MTIATARKPVADRAGDDWKHVAPADFLREGVAIDPIEAARLATESALPEAWARMVFVGGRFRADLSRIPEPVASWSVSAFSSPSGASEALRPGALDPAGHALLPLSLQTPTDGLLLRVAEGMQLPGPVQVIAIASGSSWLRHVAILGASATATIVETHVSAPGAEASTRSVFEADLPAGAHLEHVRIQLEAPQTRSWSALVTRLAANAVLDVRHAGLGAGIARCEIHTDIAGSGAKLAIEGIVASCDEERFDALTSIHHRARDCSSSQNWKTLARDRSVGSFTGGILVAEGADGTSATQSSRNVLLSREAAIHSLPKLRIWADDVKCSHGSATGRLDEKALFFLRSRGLSALDARKLLVKAFAEEILGKIPWESLRGLLESRLGARI